MAKVHPLLLTSLDSSSSTTSSSSSSSSCTTSKKETFTIWMKSLLMQGNGCTVYNENGDIVYRIDNYDQKNSNEVYLMDLRGKVLFTILRKKLSVIQKWEGYKSNGSKSNGDKPLFQVRKGCKVFGKDLSCKIAVKSDNGQAVHYRLEGLAGKSALRIIDSEGKLVAEAKRKQLSSGVVLGDDVLTMVMETQMDHSLIMALVTVYGLIRRKI
ncbi:hypothetical protein FEM48_Zijuj11G0037900 [Ziziphus jujuba var. spinosa]|uniref:Protein LURP-one-related 11 n=1 Tax=Ziziphus jujuba var. spinosa TaxID=714518 RepID=A0A978UGM6_ZIZJJ|nr:hypothetical protein FEM48_Zijuj11G0037900 [Ziziphus jujuba var. spinosa]